MNGLTTRLAAATIVKEIADSTVVMRFTSTGMTGNGMFENKGFDTGSLIETVDGWRILHYSSFEHFSWNGDF